MFDACKASKMKAFGCWPATHENTMKLVIFGSTGGTGRELVKQALEQGHMVTAYARNPVKIDDIKHANLSALDIAACWTYTVDSLGWIASTAVSGCHDRICSGDLKRRIRALMPANP